MIKTEDFSIRLGVEHVDENNYSEAKKRLIFADIVTILNRTSIIGIFHTFRSCPLSNFLASYSDHHENEKARMNYHPG